MATGQARIDFVTQNETLIIKLTGHFCAPYISEIDKTLRDLSLNEIKSVELDFAKIEQFDTAGAWIINRLINELKRSKIKYSQINVEAHVGDLLALVEKYSQHKLKREPISMGAFVDWLDEVGRTAIRELNNSKAIIYFLGEVVVVLGSCLLRWRHIRFISVIVFLQRVGFNALPIIGLISFLIGVILIYQGDYQLSKFGAEIYAIDLLAISMLREVGILLTAIVVAGRSGSAFTAQIGTMKLNQEVDAMRIIGLNPLEVLVVPRTLALVIAMPLLVFYTDIMGILGGAFMARLTMDISFDQFLNELHLAIGNWTFWVGMIKAPVFAFIISLIGCFEGMQVKEGAESVGTHTTRSVVESIFLIIIFNALFSVMFTYMEI